MSGQAYYSNGRTNFPPTPAGLSAAQKIPRTPTSATSQARPQQLQFNAAATATNNAPAPATAPAPSAPNYDNAPAHTVKIAPAPINKNAPTPAPAPTQTDRPHTYGDSDNQKQGPQNKSSENDSASESETDDASPLDFETVLEDSMNTMDLSQMDPSKTNTHYGIHSLHDLYAHQIKRHDDLAKAIQEDSRGRTLRKEIKWFRTNFKSRKNTTGTVAAAATVIHMAATSAVWDTTVRNAIMASAGKSRSAMKKLVNDAAGGEMIHAGMGTTRDLRDMHWTYVCDLAIEMACCCYDSRGEIDEAQKQFEECKAGNSHTIQHAMSAELKVWNEYRTAFGRDPMDVYFRSERFVDGCSSGMRKCYWEIVDENTDVDTTVFTEWHQFQEIFVRAWVMWERRKYRKAGDEKIPDNKMAVHHSSKQLNRQPDEIHDQMAESDLFPPPGHQQNNQDADIIISCASPECHSKFVFALFEQQKFKEKNWDMPRRCKKCRDELRASNGTPIGSCHAFLSSGKCDFGDKCKFSHAGDGLKAIEDKKPAAPVHHVSIGSESDDESDSSSSSFLEMECYHLRRKVDISSNYTFSYSDTDSD
jgi:hypothetical protein